MSAFLDDYARLYDLFYKEKPYKEESAMVHSWLGEFGSGEVKSLLELSCGTGTHAFELEKYGYSILATDYSDAMLDIARKKALMLSSQVEFLNQDMCSLDLAPRTFDAAISLFDSIGYVISNDNLDRTLQGVYNSLISGGLFIVEFWHGSALLRHYDSIRIKRWPIDEGEILRISETRLDYANQIGIVSYTIYEFNKDMTYEIRREVHTNRYFFIQEMALFLKKNGFHPLKWFDGYTLSEKITDNSWHILAIAQKQ